ncbi:MAG: response regulator transcription factor [Gammaproteobacteria bacterium]|nr:response regulator transcription factor [Gammaproteobacteria bacterium]
MHHRHDESLARRGLELRLDAFAEVEIVAQCGNGREAIAAIETHRPDAVFLDIQMPGLDGFDVVRRLQGDEMPIIVFVTAFDRYAVTAFELHALDYLLKPVEADRLAATVERIRERITTLESRVEKFQLLAFVLQMMGKPPGDEVLPGSPDRLRIRDGNEVILIAMEDIDWIDAAGDYMCVHSAGKTHVMRSTMKTLETQLDVARFQRIHRSTIVNVERVVKLTAHDNGEYFLTLNCGARLKLSRTYRDKLARFL